MLHRLFYQVIQSIQYDSLSGAWTVSGAGTVPLNGLKNNNRAACDDSTFEWAEEGAACSGQDSAIPNTEVLLYNLRASLEF